MTLKGKLFFLILLLIPCWVMGIRYQVDFPTLYLAVERAGHGAPEQVYRDKTGDVATYPGKEPFHVNGHYFYPPFSLSFFQPLTWFSYPVAKWVWLGVQTLCFCLFWKFLSLLYPVLLTRQARWTWILAWIVAINPIHNNFQSNNIQILLAAILFGAEVLTYRQSKALQCLAGVLVCVAAGLKVYPAFMCAYYFLFKPNSTRMGIVLGTLLVFLLPFPFFGFDTSRLLYQGFFASLPAYSQDNSLTATCDILSYPAMVTIYLGRFLSPEALKAVINYSSVLIAGALFFSIWRMKQLTKYEPLNRSWSVSCWALVLAIMTFLTPSARPHYLIFLVPAFVSLAEQARVAVQGRALFKAAVSIAVVFVALTAEGVIGKYYNDILEEWKIPVMGIAILCIALWIALKKISTSFESVSLGAN